jgi:adenylate kinase
VTAAVAAAAGARAAARAHGLLSGHPAQQLVLLGPPGSGKSTVAARLAERLGLDHVETGSLFRRLAAQDSELGREVAAAAAAGRLVPDDLVERVVREQLERLPAERGYVLDGFPRNAAQADVLRRLLAELRRQEPRPVAVLLDVPREVLADRLRRRRDRIGREDDSEETAARRLELYEEQASPLLDALAGWSDVMRVDAARPVEAVAGEIAATLRDRS